MTYVYPDLFRPIDSFSGNFKDPKNLKIRPCPICDDSNYRSVLSYHDFQFFTDSSEVGKRADIEDIQCLNCLCLYRHKVFSESGFSTLAGQAGCSYGSSAQRPKETVDWLSSHNLLTEGLCILDVGCYEGSFLSRLPSNLSRMGVDIDAPAISRGRQRHPELSLIHGQFDAFIPDQRPDVITMFMVLEHLPNPKAALRHLRDIGKKGVRLVIEIPIIEQGKTNDINGFFSVLHLTGFSRNTIRRLLENTGWQILHEDSMDDYNGLRIIAQSDEKVKANNSTEMRDIKSLQAILGSWFRAQSQIEERISALPQSGKFLIWGAGLHTEVLYHLSSLFRHRERRFLLIDSDKLKQGQSWRGINIVSPEILYDLQDSNFHLIISSYGDQPAILSAAIEKGVSKQRICLLYDSISVH